MSTEGLTRRRGAGGSPSVGTSTTGTFDALPPPSSSIPKPASRSSAPTSVAGGGGGSGAVEGRGKVAYDPRDFENGGETQQMPRLTIMEEVLLLGLKDKAVGLEGWLGCGSSRLTPNRVTYLFGMTTSLTLSVDASSSSSLSVAV